MTDFIKIPVDKETKDRLDAVALLWDIDKTDGYENEDYTDVIMWLIGKSVIDKKG